MLLSTIRALQSLLDGQRILAIAVLAGEAPLAGLLPFVPLPNYSGVYVHASRLSRHSQGLYEGARASILLHEQDGPGQDPLQIRRATFDCRVHPLERGSTEWEAGRERYLERFPDSRITFRLADFTLHQLDFQSGLYVAGFGRAMTVAPRDILRLAEP